MKQKTLGREFTLKGKGLHTGQNAVVLFCPAEENYGYKIERTDLSNKPIIAANAKNVTSTDRGTTLSEKGFSVGTVEHALAALYGCSIDNCHIKIYGSEFPILDGSAAEYVKKIRISGIKEQNVEREFITIRNKIEYIDELSGSRISIFPDEKFSIDLKVIFDSDVIGEQSVQFGESSDFDKEIATCRTFVFVKDIKVLLQKGLIKGGNFENAIVVYDTPIGQKELDELADIMSVEKRPSENMGYLSPLPLKYPNELARHKLLDLIGDLALSGQFIKGKIVAYCPGHRVNNLFVRTLIREIK